jgi:hypothetical protein
MSRVQNETIAATGMTDAAMFLARDKDGCELFADPDHDGDIPLVQLNAVTPWDTHIRVDLTVEQARQVAALVTKWAGLMPKGTTSRNVRIGDDLWAAVLAKAESEGRTASEVVRELLSRWVMRPPRKR